MIQHMKDNIIDWWYTLGSETKTCIKVFPLLILLGGLVYYFTLGRAPAEQVIEDPTQYYTQELTTFESPNQTTGEVLSYNMSQSQVQQGQIADGLYIAGISYSELDRQPLRDAGVVMHNYGSLEERALDIGLERNAPLLLIKGGQIYEIQTPNTEEVLQYFN